MKKIIFNIAVSLLFVSCINNKNDMITIIDCNGISGKPEYMLFKTEKEGYMFNYKGGLYSESNIFAYKTINGGIDWKQIYSQNGFYFYGDSKLYNNAIFGTVREPENIVKSNLFKLDLTTQKFELLEFNTLDIDGIGGRIWVMGDSISVFFNKDKHNGILKTDTNFTSYSVKPFNYTTKNGVIVSDHTHTYFITWDNKLVIETNNTLKEIAINAPECITLIYNGKLLIATNENDNRINLVSYDTELEKFEKLHTFENYSIISHLQSNENVIVGFVGNIKGMFVSYDLVYSTDKGQTWKIQKLKEKKLVAPNCLVDNVLYIYSGRKLQKITF